MINSFFDDSLDKRSIEKRIRKLSKAKIGFYSIGLYPASLAYNSVMQRSEKSVLLAPRPGRDLMGAFSPDEIRGMDSKHVTVMQRMARHREGDKLIPNDLAYLIEKCDLVILAANSKYIEQDLVTACKLRKQLNRQNVVLACLAGSFSHDKNQNNSYVLCEKNPNLAFFSGFHRHGALRSPVDSFTANFCHPNALIALIGAQILNKLSPNIQVSPGIHNVEAQYLKAAKNMASIFAGFGHKYHQQNTGVLPTLLSLLLNQCLDQAATVSMLRHDRQKFYSQQPIALTELGYAVPRIEATLSKDGIPQKVRDHTFSQLMAIVADVRGSMMLPVSGMPTRNFQAGQALAKGMLEHNRCPLTIEEFEQWCEEANINKSSLEGLKALRYWPQIKQKYSIQGHESSMVDLLYQGLYGDEKGRILAFEVMGKSRELSNYCQESIRHNHSRKYAEALNNIGNSDALELISKAVVAENAQKATYDEDSIEDRAIQPRDPAYLKIMDFIKH